MNRVLFLLGSLVIFLSACNKTDDTVSAQEDLRAGAWVRTSGKITYKDSLTRGDSTMDYMSSQDDCRKDNKLNFKDNFEGLMDMGTLHCTAGEPDSKAFTWQITADEKRLSLYNVADFFPTDNIDADILTRTLGYLTIRYKVITMDPAFKTADTVIYTDVLRRN